MRIVALILMLMVPGPAWADAWVLWQVTKANPGKAAELLQRPVASWAMPEGFDTRKDCEDALARRQTRAKANPLAPGSSRMVSDRVIIDSSEAQGTSTSMEFVCLPAGVDPRPRCAE